MKYDHPGKKIPESAYSQVSKLPLFDSTLCKNLWWDFDASMMKLLSTDTIRV